MTLYKGWVDTHPDKAPPKSGKGFQWPGRSATDEQRRAFQKNFTNHLRARGENHREFARRFFGEGKSSNGYTAPKNPGTVLRYAMGQDWPTEARARQFAAIFKVPLEQLLVDDGAPFEPLALIRPTRASAATRRKMNGHGGNGHAAAAQGYASHGAPASGSAEPAPLPARPAGAMSATLHIDGLPDAPDYCNVTISGTVRYDTAMALVNIVGRDQHGFGPRK